MAARNVGKLQPSHLNVSYEQIEKTSSTLKRHPKMELSKPDLLQLLGVLEGELQAREIVIAVLKAEQVKQLLYPKKKGAPNDPWAALQRDCFGGFDATFDEASVKNLYNLQLSHLENFIRQQKNAQNKLREQLQAAEERCEKLLSELEDEKRKHAQDTAQGDDVTYLLEKERERLHQENEFERQQNRCMEKDIKCLSETLEQERERQKQIVLLLLAERKRLTLRFVEEKQKSERLSQILCDEKGRIADMVDGLEEESKKSLQMEAEMERQLCEFEMEKEQFKADMTIVEEKNQELQLEVQKLQEELEIAKKQASAAAQLGEGVRSSIVTMVSTPTIRAAPTVSPTVSPPRSVARAVVTKVGPAPATPAKPPGLVPQVMNKVPTVLSPKPALQATTGISSGQPVTTAVKVVPRPEKPISTVSSASLATTTIDALESPTQPSVEGIMSPSDPDKPAATSENVAPGQKAVPCQKISPVLSKMPSVSISPVVKKMLPIGRGAPPPIPPNKPILPPQALHRKESMTKPPVPPRTELTADGEPKKPPGSVLRYGVILPKAASMDERLSGGSSLDKDEAQVGEIISNCTVLSTTVTTSTTSPTANLGSEVLGRELADFQQVLVSMASNKASEA